jgi:hypothetical protein
VWQNLLGVGSISSFVTNGEVLLKYLFFQSCQGILELTDSQLGTVKIVRGDEFCKRVQVSTAAQKTWSVYFTQLGESRILRYSRFG